VQGCADADHARTQYENIGLEIRHPGTPKVECYIPVPAAYSEAGYCGSGAQTDLPPRKSRLHGGQTLATMD
jgi:hypothetical protein